jgi:hypothetical protein
MSVALNAANMTVNVVAVGLIVLGVLLFVVTISFWRGAVEDPAVLAPLEVMEDRKFARADLEERNELLNKFRTSDSPVITHSDVSSPLLREPSSEPERPYQDPFPHDDDAVDVVPNVIDPLLNRQNQPRIQRPKSR